ncbi:MAG TPA: protein kinase [Pyrinomonadaceae bacterium]|jgi:serine/threonine protein kinase
MSSPFSLLAEGSLLQGRYRIKHLIARGGMGAVYETRDERLGHTLALKQNFYGDDEHLKHAFEREARLLANLKHPALPHVTDYFTEEFGQCLVMEFIAGKDLLAQLKERGQPFPVETVLAWAEQLLDALNYLHTQQPPIIHRDVKPQNLKLSTRGHIMLLDFGLAKGTTSGLTSIMAGSSVVGFTPGYAPPEQVTGKGTDERSDLFSLGATLYYLLTNRPPPDAMVRLGETTNDDPDPLRPAEELNPLVPPALSALLHKAMALKRRDRPASAETMRRALSGRPADEEEKDEETTVHAPEAETTLRLPAPAPAHTPRPDVPLPRPQPVVINIPPTPKPPVKADLSPQVGSSSPWALLVASLYLFIIVALTCPLFIVTFWPKPGGDPTNVIESWPNFGDVYLLWPYWVFVGILIFSQFALLKVPVGVANRRPLKRRSVLLPLLVTGLMAGLLVVGVIYSVYEFVTMSWPSGWENLYVILAVGGLTWVLWTAVFYRMSRYENPEDVITRQCRYLFRGSILELLIAVPTHIVARSRDYCCAGFMTFIGITLGIAVLLLSYGPGVFFLFVERWHRLHRYRTPPEGSPSDVQPPRK